jgi:PhoH-like ATPase
MTKLSLVLDTSSIINHPNIFFLLEDTNFIVPIEVLEELDNAKVRNDTSGFNARKANRIIDEIKGEGSLTAGVEFGARNSLRISMESDLTIVPSIFSQNVDSKIISVAKKLTEERKLIRLVSSDISLRIKANSIGINSVSDDELLLGKEDLLYSGCKVINTEQENITAFYKEGFVGHSRSDLFPNQAVVLKSGENSSALGIVRAKNIIRLRTDKKDYSIMGMTAKNKEQRFALEYLLDPNIPMVSIAGVAGTGKTMIAAITAMYMLNEGMYDKIVICRPAVSVSAGIGFLPGTKLEKLQPWIQPIFDNLKHIMKCTDMYLNLLIEKGKIEVESLSYIRGRTFPKTIVIIDEAQNSTPQEMKAIITRMGEGSKLMITGDLEQIDSVKLDIYSSGLSIVANKFKQSELSAHITLQKTERSELSALAAKLL